MGLIICIIKFYKLYVIFHFWGVSAFFKSLIFAEPPGALFYEIKAVLSFL